MSVIFFFIDGVGIGVQGSSNPFFLTKTPGLDRLYKEGRFFQADSTLGVKGLPQSATGQTAIFTGKNAPKIIGRHLSGRPTENLSRIIEENNIFKELKSKGFTVNYANVYRNEYIENISKTKSRRERPSVTTVMSLSAGLVLRNVTDYNNESGVYHDISGDILQESGYEVKILTPAEASKRLVKISISYDFTLFEHFMSDIIGHKGDMQAAVKEVRLLDEFVSALLAELNFDEDLLVIASDHGNLEDKSVKTHTMNKVPVIFYGKMAEDRDIEIDSLADIMPQVIKIMENMHKKIGGSGD
jgi:2,3-bisphosphoglycerate-independent phosphoglycerate mutase